MNYSLTAIGGRTRPEDARRLEIVGAVCQLAALSRVHGSLPLKEMIERLRSPVELGQVEVFHNHFGRCMGYATWAFLCPEVEQRLLRTENLALKDYEWNEGSSLWIIDLLVPFGSIRHVMAQMRDKMFARMPAITYFRYKAGRRLCKQLSRTDTSHFWSSGSGAQSSGKCTGDFPATGLAGPVEAAMGESKSTPAQPSDGLWGAAQ